MLCIVDWLLSNNSNVNFSFLIELSFFHCSFFYRWSFCIIQHCHTLSNPGFRKTLNAKVITYSPSLAYHCFRHISQQQHQHMILLKETQPHCPCSHDIVKYLTCLDLLDFLIFLIHFNILRFGSVVSDAFNSNIFPNLKMTK